MDSEGFQFIQQIGYTYQIRTTLPLVVIQPVTRMIYVPLIYNRLIQ